MKRQTILNRVEELLKTISTANGFNTDPKLVQYSDGTPSEYDNSGVEISYIVTTHTPVALNKRWDYDGVLQVVATIYGDRTPQTECQVEADILKAFGSNQTLSGEVQFLRPNGEPWTTETAVAGQAITVLTLSFALKYSTPQWES